MSFNTILNDQGKIDSQYLPTSAPGVTPTLNQVLFAGNNTAGLAINTFAGELILQKNSQNVFKTNNDSVEIAANGNVTLRSDIENSTSILRVGGGDANLNSSILLQQGTNPVSAEINYSNDELDIVTTKMKIVVDPTGSLKINNLKNSVGTNYLKYDITTNEVSYDKLEYGIAQLNNGNKRVAVDYNDESSVIQLTYKNEGDTINNTGVLWAQFLDQNTFMIFSSNASDNNFVYWNVFR